MKKLIIPTLVLSAILTAPFVQAETMKGKVVSKQNNVLQVQGEGTQNPTTLKTTDNTDYFVKKKIKKDYSKNDKKMMPETDEIVEIIYYVDPETNELIIDELVMIID